MNINDFILAGKLAGSGGSGGNPNSVQVITGTLAEPWGDFENGEELYSAIKSGNASAILALDISALSMGLDEVSGYLYSGAKTEHYVAFYSTNASFNLGALAMAYNAAIFYSVDGSEDSSNLEAQVGSDYHDLGTYANLIPTTLTIYSHPMPETEGE